MALILRKEISADNGATWQHVTIPPGPEIMQGVNPLYRFTVGNTSTDVINLNWISDDKLQTIVTNIVLQPGSSRQFVQSGTWAFGSQVNIATANGQADGVPVQARSRSCYIGIVTAAAISLLKEISPDNGLTWFDASTPPGPTVCSGLNPLFRYTVVNAGNETLTDVEITDDKLGTIASGLTLTPGQGQQFVDTDMWSLGQQVNSAIASGTADGVTVTDSHENYYIGVVPAPAFMLQKLVSVDRGATFLPAPTPPGPTLPRDIHPIFRYVITNTGNTPLFDITLTDSQSGPVPLPTNHLLPDDNIVIDMTGTWRQGQQANVAMATATIGEATLREETVAFYFGQRSTLPLFPDLSNPAPRSDIFDRLLESIALEELALAALVNAEAEKVQTTAAIDLLGPLQPREIVALNSSVERVMQKIVAKEQTLRQKLEQILSLKETDA